jgi:hypothetical protein
MLVGGLLLVGGSLAPWAQMSVLALERSVGGLDGDGKLTIVAGVLIVVLVLTAVATKAAKGSAIAIALLALVAGAIAIYDTVDVNDKAHQAEALSPLVSATVGWGLYVVMTGAGIALVGALVFATAATSATISGAPPVPTSIATATAVAATASPATTAAPALWPCPCCAESMPASAATCPHCGRDVTPVTAAPAALPGDGWYADPFGRHPDRWWDGAQWTQWVRDHAGGTRSEDPPVHEPA